jgi:tRNA1(Val) A37 N6-methylase TrmN6
MRELLRTTNLVRLSWVQALLAESKIHAVVLDSHMSVLEGSANAIPRRLAVSDDDYPAAVRVLEESGELGGKRPERATDGLLGGRITLLQPENGYRAAVDPVLLAAAVPAVATNVLDVGCGTGAAALCYAERAVDAQVVGLELQPEMAHLAIENVRLNGMEDRVSIHIGSLLNYPPALKAGSFDEVMANPPYLPAERADLRTPPADVTATVEGDATLKDWIAFCLEMAALRGFVTMIHRADRLDEILALLQECTGDIVVFPIWPGTGANGFPRDARRVIVRARKGANGPMRLAAGMVLHDGDEYSDAADAILRLGQPLAI